MLLTASFEQYGMDKICDGSRAYPPFSQLEVNLEPERVIPQGEPHPVKLQNPPNFPDFTKASAVSE